MRRLLAAVRLLAVVALETLRANLLVAAVVLDPRRRNRPGFARVPLALRGDVAITVLATIITMIPGTMTVDLTPDHRASIVHIFDMTDGEAEVALIKRRLERLVAEVFE